VVIWEAQNMCYEPLIRALKANGDAAQAGDPTAQRWMSELEILRDKLRIQSPAPAPAAAPTEESPAVSVQEPAAGPSAAAAPPVPEPPPAQVQATAGAS